MLLCGALLAGCSSVSKTTASSAASGVKYACRTINYYDYSKPVPATTDPVEDSYWQDTFFGGDSRMGSLYLYSDLRDKGATIWYQESLSLYGVESTAMSDSGSNDTLYNLLMNNTKHNIYLMLGLNEIRNSSFEDWESYYDEIIQEVKQKQPDAKIYLMGSYHPLEVSGLDDDQLSQQLNLVNGAMQDIAAKEHIYYYDTNDGLTDDSGKVRSDLLWDGIHFNQDGAQAFADQIALHVVKEDIYVKKVCE